MKAQGRRNSFRLVRPLVYTPVRRSRKPTAAAAQSIAAAVDLYVRQLPQATSNRGRRYSRRTVDNYRYNLQRFVRWCGPRTVADLSAQLVLDYRASLRAERYADWTVSGSEVAITAFLAWARGRGITGTDLADAPRTRARDRPVTVFTEAELAAMLAVCDPERWDGTRNRAILVTLWRTGLRAAELCDLDLDDYDSDRQTLRVRHGKGDKPRLVGVPDDAAAAIDDWLLVARGRDPGALFPSERGGPLKPQSLAWLIHKLGSRAGVEKAHAHRFRHSFAVGFLKAGGDVYTLARVLGHGDLQMTQRYLRGLRDEEVAEEHVRILRRGR